ncbi:unnamed protein product, partial [marine sediment metagenome]
MKTQKFTIDEIWDRMGTIVYLTDYRNRMCAYIHPIVLAEWKTMLPKEVLKVVLLVYDEQNPFVRDDDFLYNVLWNGLDDLYYLDDVEIRDENGWFLLDDVLRVSLNSPQIHALCNRSETSFFDISDNLVYSSFVRMKKEICLALKRHAWKNVLAVSSLESTESYSGIDYEVYHQRPEGSSGYVGKYYLRMRCPDVQVGHYVPKNTVRSYGEKIGVEICLENNQDLSCA